MSCHWLNLFCARTMAAAHITAGSWHYCYYCASLKMLQ